MLGGKATGSEITAAAAGLLASALLFTSYLKGSPYAASLPLFNYAAVAGLMVPVAVVAAGPRAAQQIQRFSGSVFQLYLWVVSFVGVNLLVAYAVDQDSAALTIGVLGCLAVALPARTLRSPS